MSSDTLLRNLGAYCVADSALKRLCVLFGYDLSIGQVRILYQMWGAVLPSGYSTFRLITSVSQDVLRTALPDLVDKGLIDRIDRRYSRYTITINGRAFLQQLDQAVALQVRQTAKLKRAA